MDFDPFALSMQGCDEDTSKKLMNLQFNANKLHIEFHQKAVALRTKYEANLEMVFQALKVHNNKLKPNNDTTVQSVQTETNYERGDESTTVDEEEADDVDDETSRDTSLPRNHKSLNRKTSTNNNNNQVVHYRNNNNNQVVHYRNNKNKNKNSHNKIQSYRATNNSNNEGVVEAVELKQEQLETTKDRPCFWLTVFLNSKYTLNKIQVADQAPLHSMTNLKVNSDLSHLESNKAYRFILEFYFRKNEYFTNNILTKEYFVQLKSDDDSSKMDNRNNNSNNLDLDLSGAAFVQCRGCQIDWKAGMNITEIEVRSAKKDRPVVNRSYKKSFFNFFSPPTYGISEELSSKQKKEIEDDYTFGLHLKEKVIPRAISYYMGQNCDEGSNSSSSDSSETIFDSSISATSTSVSN